MRSHHLPSHNTIAFSWRNLPLPIIIYFLAILVPVHFYLGPLYMTSVRVLLLAFCLPLTINLLLGKYGKIILTDILFMIFPIWMSLALLANNPNMVIGQMGSVGVEFLCGYLLARAYIRDEASFVSMIAGLVLIITITAPFAVFELLTGRPFIIEFIRKLPAVFSEKIVTIAPRMGLERAQVILAHPIHYGLFCSTAFSLLLVGCRDIINNQARILLTGVILFCVFASLSSGALLPVILQIALLVWAMIFNSVQRKWLWLIALIIVVYVVIDLLSNRTPMRVFMSYATFSSHNAYWRGLIFEWGMKNVWDNPIWGLGFNDWIRPHYMYSGSMDNFWLVLAVRYGIPGFLFIAIGYAFVIFKIAFRDFDVSERIGNLRRAWMFTFIGITLTLATVHIWTTVFSFTFFLFGSGVWMIHHKLKAVDPQVNEQGGDRPALPTEHNKKSRYTSYTSGQPQYTRFKRGS